jgi:diaminopimelate epimerase
VAGIAFVKGHGTENDFVVLPDPDAALDLTAPRVRALCDRASGLGADGVLRVVPTREVPEVADQAVVAAWFMDHRNADGSHPQMCGNGVRVFARYLFDAGLAAGDTVTVATRGGPREVTASSAGFAVDMGEAQPLDGDAVPLVTVGTRTWPAVGVHLPNPHAVVFVDDLGDAGRLLDPPEVTPRSVYPEGVNVEFVVPLATDLVAMRVFERGVGETRSCGTGACAVVWAWRREQPDLDVAPTSVTVDVPGGTVVVTERADGHLVLTGPAIMVADGTIDAAWWASH